MPIVLILAFAASLGFHAVVLFGTDLDLAVELAAPPLMAELKPLPRPAPLAAPAPATVPTGGEAPPVKAAPAKPPPRPRHAQQTLPPPASASPLLTVPDASALALPQHGAPSAGGAPADAVALASGAPAPTPAPNPPPTIAPPAAPRLPAHGMIRYRVDRGDSNFEVGYAEHEWTIADGRYRLTSVAETTGLVWLFKSVRIEMESRGRLGATGLQPQTFAVRRNGQPTTETADFDWDAMSVRVGKRAEQPLDDGAQDLLSFNYQLGYMALPQAGSVLPIATGKKYAIYHLDVLGDETLELPAGSMRTLHLRTPGENGANSNSNSTELWLAYDYLLLPVKIRYVDARGDSFVQIATKLLVGDENDQRHDQSPAADQNAPNDATTSR